MRERIDPRLNGLSVNWYDAAFGHYMVLHRDNTKNLVTGAPIVAVSLGAERVFRLRPWWPGDLVEFTATHGKLFVMPFETNRVWRHGVPHRSTDTGRRISITLRAFKPLDGNRDERTAAAYQTASATKERHAQDRRR